MPPARRCTKRIACCPNGARPCCAASAPIRRCASCGTTRPTARFAAIISGACGAKRGQFQYRSFTREDRYPRIFEFLGAQLASAHAPRLLSFGCATGEEVFSLRRHLPRAFIKGVDINERNIAEARARLELSRDAGIEFAVADSASAEAPDSYDAVLCLAVFQHSALKDPAIVSCADYVRFEDFEATLTGLVRALKPGGYLAIRHADFRFTDAACSAEFTPVLRIAPGGEPHPRFDRHNRRLPSEHDADVVFQKCPQA